MALWFQVFLMFWFVAVIVIGILHVACLSKLDERLQKIETQLTRMRQL